MVIHGWAVAKVSVYWSWHVSRASRDQGCSNGWQVSFILLEVIWTFLTLLHLTHCRQASTQPNTIKKHSLSQQEFTQRSIRCIQGAVREYTQSSTLCTQGAVREYTQSSTLCTQGAVREYTQSSTMCTKWAVREYTQSSTMCTQGAVREYTQSSTMCTQGSVSQRVHTIKYYV